MAAPSDQSDALKRQAPCACACSCDREAEEPMYHERKLSRSTTTSFSSPAASPSPSCASSSTDYHPAANKLSSESIPFAGPGPDHHDLAKLSSISSTSSYESFFHIEASDFGATGGAEFLDFEPPSAATSTLAPAVQTIKAGGAPAAYDPKRLPSSMFRTRSTSPAEWSATSNESLFSIQLSSNSGDLTALYADLYYDAAGVPRFPSARKLPSLSSSSSARSGGRASASRTTAPGAAADAARPGSPSGSPPPRASQASASTLSSSPRSRLPWRRRRRRHRQPRPRQEEGGASWGAAWHRHPKCGRGGLAAAAAAAVAANANGGFEFGGKRSIDDYAPSLSVN